ncbi:MAG: hypothetical protein E7284_02590 [Lachnospiraceae bacterium]|nr:hypothetical protein [Lachnospiraceae bacterium]
MSSCRCEDIKRCKEKIEKIIYIESSLNAMDAQVTNLNNITSSLFGKVGFAYEGINVEEFKGIITDLDNDIYGVKRDFQAVLSNKKQLIKNELQCLENEDRDFHEEEKMAALAREEGIISE